MVRSVRNPNFEGVVLVPENLGARDGRGEGEVAMHDGSDGNSAGLYRWDNAAGDWVYIEGSGSII